MYSCDHRYIEIEMRLASSRTRCLDVSSPNRPKGAEYSFAHPS